MDKLSYSQVSSLIKYDGETGYFLWIKRPIDSFSDKRCGNTWNTRFAGKRTFISVDDKGYFKGGILGATYSAQRVAWLLHYGEWPNGEIDHIDGDKKNNRIINLRDVPRKINSRNQKRRPNNKSGAGGVILRKDTKKWAAFMHVDGKKINLGCYSCFEEAVSARQEANKDHGFTERHGR